MRAPRSTSMSQLVENGGIAETYVLSLLETIRDMIAGKNTFEPKFTNFDEGHDIDIRTDQGVEAVEVKSCNIYTKRKNRRSIGYFIIRSEWSA